MTESGTTTIHTWAEQRRNELADFISYWMDWQAVDGESYPARLGPGEWDDQFSFYRDSQAGEGSAGQQEQEGQDRRT